MSASQEGLFAKLARAAGLRARAAPEDEAAERLGLTPAQPPKKTAPPKARALTPPGPKPRAGWRLALVAVAFVGAMGAATLKLAAQANQQVDPPAQRSSGSQSGGALAMRAPMVDRNGAALADSVRTYDLYYDLSATGPAGHKEAIAALAEEFDTLTLEALARRIRGGGTRRVWSSLTPREAQRAHNLGLPGLYVSERADRVYHAGRATAHLLGYTKRAPGVVGAGQAGAEGGLDAQLSQPSARPIKLSVDLRLQLAVRDSLQAAIERTSAKGGAAVILSPRTGEVLALVSLPDFDPHDRAAIGRMLTAKAGGASPLFNRAVAGRYELGSTLKVVTWALALETRAGAMIDVYPPPQPFRVSGRLISDDHKMPALSFPLAFAKSSNVISAQLALKAGRVDQKALFDRLGLHAPLSVELAEARASRPQWTRPWNDAATATTSYGHGVAMTPLHLAETFASLINGGRRVRATLLAGAPNAGPADRVVRPETSRRVRDLMRLAVTDGTGRRADIPGLEVGGKTGTADKTKPGGGYFDDRVHATFVSAFPMSAPEAVVLVTLDEPSIEVDGRTRRSASFTAVPAAREIIERAAPLLGVTPSPL